MQVRKQPMMTPRKRAAALRLALRTEFKVAAATANAKLNKQDLDYSIVDQAKSQTRNELLETFGTLHSSSDSSPEEFTAAMFGRKSVNSGYDFTSGFVVAIRVSGKICSAAVIVTKTVKKKRIVELIWFATHNKMRKQGYGDILLRCIRHTAENLSAVAILVESSDTALGWWISRRDVPVCTRIISTCDSDAMTKEAKWSKYVTEDIQSRLQSSATRGSLGKFEVTADAPDFLSLFYEHEDPSGDTYRYKSCDANHVWIPVDTSSKGKPCEMWKHCISRAYNAKTGKSEYACAVYSATPKGHRKALAVTSTAADTTKVNPWFAKFQLLWWACCWVLAFLGSLGLAHSVSRPHTDETEGHSALVSTTYALPSTTR
jgi:hypothetical protein